MTLGRSVCLREGAVVCAWCSSPRQRGKRLASVGYEVRLAVSGLRIGSFTGCRLEWGPLSVGDSVCQMDGWHRDCTVL